MNDTKTIIGTGAQVRGLIAGDEDLVVEGRVEGTISVTATLIVNSSGTVQADVNARCVTVVGLVIGNIEASDTVRIADGGRMAGDIKAPRVVMEEGAAFNGNIDMGEFSLAPQTVAEPAPHHVPAVSRPMSISPRPQTAQTAPLPPRDNKEPEPLPMSQRAQPAPRVSAGFSRPPMPVPSRPAPAPYPSAPPKRQGAPEPRVRPVGRVKIKRPTM